jgi:phosphoribosylanthranilate isomerase
VAAVSRTRVKVCGLTRASDAQAAVRAGADALGVILAPGHRRSLTLKQAAKVFAKVPSGIVRVGVFVDAPLDEVSKAVEVLGLDEVQLHGSEGPMYCASVAVPVVKTFRVGPGFDPEQMVRYRGAVAAVLLDTLVEGAAGGSGTSFDWELGRRLPDIAPICLAGGLRPENVREAVRRLRPAGVDVSSGVEQAPGIKDEEKMTRFVAEVRAADRENEGRAKR